MFTKAAKVTRVFDFSKAKGTFLAVGSRFRIEGLKIDGHGLVSFQLLKKVFFISVTNFGIRPVRKKFVSIWPFSFAFFM